MLRLAVLLAFLAWPALADQQAQVAIVGDSFAAGPSETEEGLSLDWTGYLAEAGCVTTVAVLAVGSQTLATLNHVQARQTVNFRPRVVIVWDAAPFGAAETVTDAVLVAVRDWKRLRNTLNARGIEPLVLAYTPPTRARVKGIDHLKPGEYVQAARALNDRLAGMAGLTLVRLPGAYDGGWLRRVDRSGAPMTATDEFHPADPLYRVAATEIAARLTAEGVCE